MNTNNQLPYVWYRDGKNNKSLPDILESEYDTIKELLLKHGAVLFKSFGIDDPQKLEACVNAFPGAPLNYAGGNSPRINVKGKVYTSTEHPATEHISLHNELSYANQWPQYIFFCCQTPALEGGNTSIANSRAILKGLSDNVKKAFSDKKVLYIRNLHGGYGAGPSWQNTFETKNKKEVELHCQANDIQYQWDEDDNLKLIEKRDGIRIHPETNEAVWFNQADQFHPSTNDSEVYEALMEIYEEDLHAMPQYVCFEDNSEIPLDMLEEIRTVGHQNTVLFDWEKGDMILLDNVLTAHGRTSFKGPRKILVSMSVN